MQETWQDRLRSGGLRVTQPRLAVLATLEQDSHLAADQVVAAVRARLGSVSVQAVYDTLHTLTAAGVLRRFEPAGSAMRYELALGDNHHHLVCRACGRVEDVACTVGAVPCAVPARTGGFVVDEAEVTYWGRCSACVDPADDPDLVGAAPSTTASATAPTIAPSHHPHLERNA